MPRRTITLAALLILLSGAAIAVAAISENTGVAYGGTSSLTGPDGVCKTVTNNSPTGKQLYVPGSTAAEWQSFVAHPPAGVTLGSCCGGSYTISSNQTNLNLFTYAGSPSCTGGSYTFTVNSGVTIGSTDSNVASLATGSWPAGTQLTLVNNGHIYGRGGNGGNKPANVAAGQPGSPGGSAISLSWPLSINNTNGLIYGGGGGGGAGGSWRNGVLQSGCGGGGGQGVADSLPGSNPYGLPPTHPQAAKAGTEAGPGQRCISYGTYVASGGDGGPWGTAGNPGATSNGTAGGVGGAAGRAVQTNGNTITWLAAGSVAGPVQ